MKVRPNRFSMRIGKCEDEERNNVEQQMDELCKERDEALCE